MKGLDHIEPRALLAIAVQFRRPVALRAVPAVADQCANVPCHLFGALNQLHEAQDDCVVWQHVGRSARGPREEVNVEDVLHVLRIPALYST